MLGGEDVAADGFGVSDVEPTSFADAGGVWDGRWLTGRRHIKRGVGYTRAAPPGAAQRKARRKQQAASRRANR